MTAQEFVDAFEELFKREKHRIGREWQADRSAAGKKPEAWSLDFGKASAELNKKLRALCAEPKDLKSEPVEEKNERTRLRWAYAYWWNRLHLLEHMAKTRLGGVKTRRNIEKGGMTLRKLISGELPAAKVHPQFLKLIDSLNHMKIGQAVGGPPVDIEDEKGEEHQAS